jgi:GTP diphosphokinase / guanosine-3',5'-bis(diphosphate) 3'-diphosphatase
MEMTVIQRLSNVIRTQRAERAFGVDALCRTLDGYLPENHVAEVRRAAEFATSVHEGQRRTSGEPYVYHPLAVARTLAELRMDHTTLMAAILHDVIEDTGVSKESLALEFGEDVAELVDGVSKVTRIEGRTRAEMQAESFRKLLLAMTKDLRVILVKLADRLHNMRTLGHVAPDKRRRIARETLDIYAPIAQRLGINFIRTELEDLAFAYLYPKRHGVLQEGVSAQLGDTRKLIREVEQKLSTTLREEGIGASVVGRQKNLYGIYQKMRRKKLKLLKVTDLLGFRVIVSKVDDCYRALGVVHHVYKPVPQEFDDWIANPKANGYQSLHTACVGPRGHKIEVQIRTRDMHHIAESGIAAHWQYKQGAREGHKQPQARAREWVAGLFDDFGNASPIDFVENVKVDLFPDEVYVFTPRGEIRQLPRGATPVDFAYAVHSDLGDHCVAARLDGALEPLNSTLANGQTVEIITARHARPNAAWLNFVKTAKARSAIRNYLRQQHEDEAVRLGRRLLEIALRELSVPASVLKDSAKLEPVLAAHSFADIEELYAAVGSGQRLGQLVGRHRAAGGGKRRCAGDRGHRGAGARLRSLLLPAARRRDPRARQRRSRHRRASHRVQARQGTPTGLGAAGLVGEGAGRFHCRAAREGAQQTRTACAHHCRDCQHRGLDRERADAGPCRWRRGGDALHRRREEPHPSRARRAPYPPHRMDRARLARLTIELTYTYRTAHEPPHHPDRRCTRRYRHLLAGRGLQRHGQGDRVPVGPDPARSKDHDPGQRDDRGRDPSGVPQPQGRVRGGRRFAGRHRQAQHLPHRPRALHQGQRDHVQLLRGAVSGARGDRRGQPAARRARRG